jgi:hypothetical protein
LTDTVISRHNGFDIALITAEEQVQKKIQEIQRMDQTQSSEQILPHKLGLLQETGEQLRFMILLNDALTQFFFFRALTCKQCICRHPCRGKRWRLERKGLYGKQMGVGKLGPARDITDNLLTGCV